MGITLGKSVDYLGVGGKVNLFLSWVDIPYNKIRFQLDDFWVALPKSLMTGCQGSL